MSEQKLLETKEKRSQKISELTVFISFGLIALTYTLFSSSSAFSIKLLNSYSNYFIFASLCGVVAILFHYIQFLCGYMAVNKALSSDDKKYDKTWKTYMLIKPCFVLKQICTLAGVLAVGVAMFRALFA
ncbi:hypothetical protein ACKJ8N_003740 [Vibrio cholerae]